MKCSPILALLLFCPAVFSQQLTVNAVVVDPNSHPYANGTAHASLVCAGNSQAYSGTSPIPRDVPTVGLDGNGRLSQVLFDTSALVDVNRSPLSCHYVYRIAEYCQIATFSTGNLTGITGAGPVDLSTQINSFAVPLSPQCTPNSGGITGVNWFLNNSLVGTEPGYDVIPGTNVTITATNDPGASRVHYTLNATGGGGGGTANYDHNGTLVGTEPTLNIIDSGSVTATVTDNPGNTRVDLTLQAAAGTGSPCDPTGLNVPQNTFCGGPVPDDGPLAVPFIQGNVGTTFNNSPPFSYTVAFLGPVTAGHKIVVEVACTSFPGLDCHPYATVTDSQTNIYAMEGHTGDGWLGVDVWTTTVATSGADTVSVGFGSGVADANEGNGVVIGEYENLGTIDTTAGNSGLGGNYTTSITTNFNSDVLLGISEMLTSSGGASLRLISTNWNPQPQQFAFDPSTCCSMLPINSYAKTIGTYSVTSNAGPISGLNGKASTALFAFRLATVPPPTSGPATFRPISVAALPFQVVPLVGQSTGLGGSAMTIGQCLSQNVGVNGAVVGNDAHATPETYPGDGFYWNAMVKQNDLVTVRVCSVISGTPTPSIYDIRVTP